MHEEDQLMAEASMARRPLRLGVLLPALTLPAWQARMLERLRAEGLADVGLVVLCDADRRRGGLTAALERRALDATHVANDAFASVDARPLLGAAEILRAGPSESADSPAAADVERIAALGLDVLVHLGGARPRGAILGAARHGVWSFAGDEEPEGFWETNENRDEIRSALWRLTAEGAERLYESTSSVDPTCVATTRNRAYWKAAEFVPRLIRRLARGEALVAQPAVGRPAAAPRRPGAIALASFLARRFARRRRARLLEKLSREQWQLLYAFGDGPRTDYGQFTPLVPPVDRLWADPHIVVRDGRHHLFLEELPFATFRGHISVMEIGEDGPQGPPVRVLERPYHLSYPHVFEWRGELYMLPESKANRTIEVYRCAEFPHRWEFAGNLMEDVAAVDATLLEHGGRWWLFANLVENPGGSAWDELFLFSADSPLSRDWTPHPANPIVSDVTRARPAGRIFSENGRLYRPSQDCSRCYGYGLNVSEITALDEARYEERVVSRLRPEWDRKIYATHSLARGGNLTVIDGQRRRWRLPR